MDGALLMQAVSLAFSVLVFADIRTLFTVSVNQAQHAHNSGELLALGLHWAA